MFYENCIDYNHENTKSAIPFTTNMKIGYTIIMKVQINDSNLQQIDFHVSKMNLHLKFP